MKCTRCRKPAEIALRAHNSSFCRPCYIFWFRRRVLRAIEKQLMFHRDDRVLVAVSGGKDSLALWHVLAEEGFHTIGFHLQLGIGAYSERSAATTREFAKAHGLDLRVRSLSDEGLTVPDMIGATRRPACAACGTAKRHHFDAAALAFDCNILVTGHNLDDEAARLFGNVLHWQTEYLARQSPVIEPSHPKFVRKVKPLYLSSELETATYAFMSGIDYLVEECPNAAGATQLTYKALLDQLEVTSPGSKASFLGKFLLRGQACFKEAEARSPAKSCHGCGMPSWGELCSFCSLRAEVERKTAPPSQNSDDGNS
jgi:uncharacterized protein (TIGR00269 family)